MLLTSLTIFVTLTSYQPIEKQTDSSPFITSRGIRVNSKTLAVSRDLLEGKVCYGDIVIIPGFGARIVEDTMNARHENWMDLLVFTHAEEKKVGVRKNVAVTVIQMPDRVCVYRGPLYRRVYP